LQNKKEILARLAKVLEAHKQGLLGGEIMPEDANPALPQGSAESYLYFTLPMALNYQRNSYTLWDAANKTYADDKCVDAFNPFAVCKMSDDELREKLLKYKTALQPNMHIKIWKTICQSLVNDFNGDVRELFSKNDNDVAQIKEYINKNKKGFPYLAGIKLVNYWLCVMEEYAGAVFKNRQCISVAPDTHIIKASAKLGVIDEQDMERVDVREYVSVRWEDVLKGESIHPIDVHSPLWLWSRSGWQAVDIRP
jgi:hypothetical protein